MTKALSDIINDFATIFKSAGINNVYLEAPDEAPTGTALPCMIPIVQSLAVTAQAGDYMRCEYLLKWYWLVTPYNKSLPVMETKARALLETVAQKLFAHVQLGDPANITHIGGVSSQPLFTFNYSMIDYPPAKYLGYTLDVMVVIKQTIVQGS